MGVLSAAVLTATLAQAQPAPAPPATTTVASPADPPNAPIAPAAAEPGPDWQLIGGIAGIVLGTGLAVVGLYSTLRVTDINDDSDFNAYRSRIPSNRNACEAARDGEQVSATGQPDPGHIADLCDEGETLQILQGIAIPTSLLVGLAGWVLVGTSDTWCGTGDGAVQIATWVGPAGGGLGITARF